MTEAIHDDEGEPHRDIVGFHSPDWDGYVDAHACEIVDDGTRGFCILVSGEHVIHEDAHLRFVWVEHGEGMVKLSPKDLHVMYN